MDRLTFENLDSEVTIWTIRLSMICLFGALALRLRCLTKSNQVTENPDCESAPMVAARNLWLLGSFFSLLHTLVAMGFYHQWSHWLAFEDTARKTQLVLGVRVGIGIYFNYAFVMIWLFDALWWIGRPNSYVQRPQWINWWVYGFLIFIAVNGTIVFESGTVRWISVAALVALITLAWQKRVCSNSGVTWLDSDS